MDVTLDTTFNTDAIIFLCLGLILAGVLIAFSSVLIKNLLAKN